MTNKRFLLMPFLLALGAVSLCAAPNPLGLNENHPYGRLSSEYVTPHVAWGRPYWAGNIRALVLAPTWTQRETVELAERLALDYTPWMTADFFQAVAPAANDQAFRFFQPPPAVVNQALEEALRQDYEVIVVGKLDWPLIPARQRLQILDRVAHGAGLVYINPPRPNKELEIVTEGGAVAGARAFILEGVPWASLPALGALAPEKLIQTAQFGNGRVVVLDYGETVPTEESTVAAWPCLTPAWDTTSYTKATNGAPLLAKLPEVQWVPYEYYQSLVAKAVVWAARKDSPLKVKTDLPGQLAWPVAGQPVAVTLSGAPRKTVLDATVRDRFDRAVTFPLSRKGRAGFVLPALPGGEYFLDVWARSPSGQTYTWRSTHFAVTDKFVFGDLTLKRTGYEGGDLVEGNLAIPRLLEGDEHLVLDLSDNFGRLVLSQPLPAVATNVAFALKLPDPLTTLHRLTTRLMRSGQEVTRQTIQFPVRCRRRWDDFNEVIWGGGGANNCIPQLSLQKLVRQDEGDAFDIGWTGATTARNVALADGWCVPYTARYGCFGGTTNHIIGVGEAANGCMSHPTTLQQLRQWGETQSAIFGPYGPLAWTHGDETFYSSDPDVCWCDYCLAVFHDYLRGVYPDLAALNAEWKTAFADWKAIKPLTLEEAKQKGVFAPWVEHCLANDRIFAGFYRQSSEALAAHDPGNRAGYDGGSPLDHPNGGADFWLLSQNLGLLQTYMGNEETIGLIRSFGRADQLRGLWYGTYGLTWEMGPNTVPYGHFFPWKSIFHGMNSTWFWTMGAPGPIGGYAPDLTSLPFFASRTEALHTIKTGLGKLLLNSHREHDGIAVHYSETSRIADALYAPAKGTQSAAYLHALGDLNHALEDAGLQYQYLSYDQVAQGVLSKQGFKVFILPRSRAVSDAECRAIREFVKNGGLLIADLLPATLNSHGTPQPKSLLADLFPSDQPGVINSIGRGKTVLIGDRLKGYGYAAYDNMAGWKALGDQSRKLAELLAQVADLRPAVRLTDRGKGPMPPTEITRFQSGSIEFVGLLRSYWMYDNAAYPVTVTFPARSHVYDVINGKYLGSKTKIAGEISYRAQLYALSPYRVRAVQVRGPVKCRAGVSASFTIAVRPAGKAAASQHVFHVEVADPAGRELRGYTVNALAENGSTQVAIPWALNDPPGQYTLTARDVMSGVKAALRIRLTAVQ